ncbi:MAG TPA: hypothetical protein VLT33_16995 [Labilithrix sp.]|nr:hypothetical protein [Labilithrix sp.]
MLRASILVLTRYRAAALLGTALAVASSSPLGCGVEPSQDLRGRGGASAPSDAPASESSGDPAAPGGYDPEKPTNTGTGHNPAGFAAIAPLLQRGCSECHHAGTWLDLGAGADAATAAKIVAAAQGNTMPPAPRAKLTAEEVAKLVTWRDGGVPAASSSGPPATGPGVTQILQAGTLATYQAALPKVAWPRLAAILKSPSTLFWDKTAIPPAYQDTVGDGAGVPLGARLNSAGRSLIVPEGKKLFSADGETWSFPFGHTAGADDAANLFIVDFMSLPADGGALLPVAYRIETSTVSGLPVKRWNWSFPRGAVLGEILMIKDGGALITAEIRTRERFADSWSTDVFRPFPTASTLATAIKAKRPSWQTNASTAALVAALTDTATLTAKHIDSPSFSNLVTLDGWVDAPLPPFGDDGLVRELLQSTTFVSAYGTSWKQSGAQRAFGASGPASGLSIVPARSDTGLLEVREKTCTKCHDQGGTFIGGLVDQAILYGDVWGVDRIFSFHPFEPSRIDASGNENRSVRPAFSAVVVPFDASEHPASVYSFYRPAP